MEGCIFVDLYVERYFDEYLVIYIWYIVDFNVIGGLIKVILFNIGMVNDIVYNVLELDFKCGLFWYLVYFLNKW